MWLPGYMLRDLHAQSRKMNSVVMCLLGNMPRETLPDMSGRSTTRRLPLRLLVKDATLSLVRALLHPTPERSGTALTVKVNRVCPLTVPIGKTVVVRHLIAVSTARTIPKPIIRRTTKAVSALTEQEFPNLIPRSRHTGPAATMTMIAATQSLTPDTIHAAIAPALIIQQQTLRRTIPPLITGLHIGTVIPAPASTIDQQTARRILRLPTTSPSTGTAAIVRVVAAVVVRVVIALQFWGNPQMARNKDNRWASQLRTHSLHRIRWRG